MITQTVFDTSQVFALHGIRHVVLSPGSRNAPLTISFARNPDITVYNVVDERSAGFIALGMAQRLGEPVVLCCTSGTSLLNYGPAISEAYYQQIPLIVVSADRPAEWLDQRDGQTINQPHALNNFIKKYFELPANPAGSTQNWDYNRKLNEAINICKTAPIGPVHINVPFREPFYPAADQQLSFSEEIRIIHQPVPDYRYDLIALRQIWNHCHKRMIVPGQAAFDPSINQALAQVKDAVTVADVIANIAGDHPVRHQDLFLASPEPKLTESLKPDLLVTFGRSVISKNLKIFLRNNPPKAHIHFDLSEGHVDTFQTMTTMIKGSPLAFLESIIHPGEVSEFDAQIRKNYVLNWKVLDDATGRKLKKAVAESEFCEFQAFAEVMKGIPAHADLHLANSMPVRYANFLQSQKIGTEVFCNRGTSGIDGTNGTAVGNALISQKPTWLLTGDLSFFYDRNAFFHSHDFSKLKIVVFNNRGGGIFRLLPGPASQPELERHFETRHDHSAKFSALEFGFDYHTAKTPDMIIKALKSMIKNDKTSQLLEIFTDPEVNSTTYHQIKKALV